MSFENIQDSLKNKSISWQNLNKQLKSMNVDKQLIAQMRSIFYSFDRTKDMTLSQDEISNALSMLNSLDKDNDGKITGEELKAAKNNAVLGDKNAGDINNFIKALQGQPLDVSETQTTPDEPASGGGTEETKTTQTPENPPAASVENKEQKLTEYTVQPGDTPERLAKKFGLEGEEAEAFIEHLKKQTNAKGWFMVGQKITLLGDHTEALKNMSDYTEDKTELDNRWANTKAGRKAIAAEEAKLPKSIQDRIASLKQSGDTYEISGDAQSGYTIKVTSGNYMTKARIGEIEMKYDSAGNLQTYTQKYNNGQVNETTYAGGKKTKIIAEPAPEKFQDIAARMQKESGGKARIEYNKETGHYEIVQTDISYKDVKEIRTVLSDTAWQEEMSSGEALKEGFKDAWDTLRLVNPDSWSKAISAGLKNREDHISDNDYFLTQTTTYSDGRVIEGTYKDGKLKTNKVIQQSNIEKTQEVPEEKINVAADISFEMPADAPEKAKEFANSLIENKAELMRQLGIDNDTYNMLAQTAIGIAGRETNFDEQTLRQTGKDVLRNIDVVGARDWSYGMTQLKYTLHIQDPTIKKHMEALDITDEKQLLDPEVSAKATIVVLASLNKRLNTERYQQGIEVAQDTIVQYKGWEINEQGIGEKTGNTVAWTNNISRQDALCALWNGGEAKSLLNGTFKPQGWQYTRDVTAYTHKYKLVETDEARAEAKDKHDETRAFEDMRNNGEMGSVVFLPAMYTDKAKHLNSSAEIRELNQSLKTKGIDGNLRNQLVAALQNGELSFDFGLSKDEINSLTNADIKLLLTHLKELKTQVNSNQNINTSDGISAQEASILRNQYAETIGTAEDKFRQEYLNNHSAVYNASDTNPKILRETSTTRGELDFVGAGGKRRGFQHEKPLPVNENTNRGKISQQSAILANAGYEVAMQNPNNTRSGYCLTGVKAAMTEAGIDVSQMTDYGNTPKYIKNWFEAHPEMFTPVEYVSLGDGTAREINASDIPNLPAGYIVIWNPGDSHEDQAGHIAITNGNGQGYADATDNLQWGNYNNNKGDSGKGEHGTFVIYKLSDNWAVDPQTGKLVLKG